MYRNCIWCLHSAEQNQHVRTETLTLPAGLATLMGCPAVAAADTTPGALRLRPRLVNIEGAPANVRTVQSRDRFVGVAFSHLHESETSRAACVSIRRQVNALHSSMRCEE